MRRFVNDLRDPRVLPAIDAPEIVALEAERVRLVAVLDAAGRGDGNLDTSRYIAQRTKAIREGTEMPPPLPNQAEWDARQAQARIDRLAAEEALLAFADTICDTVRSHAEWEAEAQERVAAALADAEAARRAAAEAERRAKEAQFLVQHLQHIAVDNLYPNTSASPEHDPDMMVWAVTDPHVLDLMERSRTGSL